MAVTDSARAEPFLWNTFLGCVLDAPTGSGRRKDSQVAPTKWPALRGISLCPNMIACSDSREMVQKGRLKSWWSMCGGMQSICMARTKLLNLAPDTCDNALAV